MGRMLLSGPRWRDPLVPVTAVLVAFALRWWLRPVIGETAAPLQLFFLAVFVAAWAGGLPTGLFATLSRWSGYARILPTPRRALLAVASGRDPHRRVPAHRHRLQRDERVAAGRARARSGQREQLLAEQAARAAALTAAAEQREQLQRVADRVPVILASCGPDRRFKFVNQANADRFGVTPADMVGRSIDEFLGPELPEEIEPYIERVLAGERVEYQMTYSLPRPGTSGCSAPTCPSATATAGSSAGLPRWST